MATTTLLHEGGIRLQHTFQEKAGSGGASGPISHEGLYRHPFNSGTGDGRISELYSKNIELAASGSVTIDLQSAEDDLGVTRTFSRIYSYYIEVTTIGGKVNLKPAASTPFSGFVDESADVAADTIPFIQIRQGAQAACWENGEAVTSSLKSITFTNPSSTAAVKFEFRLSGAKVVA